MLIEQEQRIQFVDRAAVLVQITFTSSISTFGCILRKMIIITSQNLIKDLQSISLSDLIGSSVFLSELVSPVDLAYLLLSELLPVHSLCLLGSQPLLPVILKGKKLLLLLCPHPGKVAFFPF